MVLKQKIQSILDLKKLNNLNNLIEDIVRNPRKDGRFAGEGKCIPYTHPNLIEEINEKIPLIKNRCFDTEICVIYTIEWALWLVFNGFKRVTIVTRTHDPAIERVVGGWSRVCDISEFKYMTVDELGSCKFDVVVGNPPYQDDADALGRKTSSIPLWFHFTKLSFDIVKKNGMVSLITPSSWLIPSSKINATITSKNLIEVKLFQKSPFKDALTTTCYWIAKNIENINSNIPLNIDGTSYTLTSLSFIPSKPDNFELALNIMNKTVNANNLKMEVVIDSRNHTQTKKHKLRDTKCEEFKYPVIHTNTKTFWSNQKDSLHGQPKVIASKTGSISKAKSDINSSICEIAVAIICSNMEQSENLVKVLNSKLFKFLFDAVRHSSTIPTSYWKSLPSVDLNRNWIDAQLYEQFNLTQPEKDLIERKSKMKLTKNQFNHTPLYEDDPSVIDDNNPPEKIHTGDRWCIPDLQLFTKIKTGCYDLEFDDGRIVNYYDYKIKNNCIQVGSGKPR